MLLGHLEADAPYALTDTSVLRQVASEPVVALLIDRALVMELAHPKVGAAVADHSQFRRRPISRLWRTSDAAMRILFGGSEVARGAAEQIYRVHDHISGHLVDGEARQATAPHHAPGDGGHEAGASDPLAYTAHDATLLLWVWATLVDSLEVGFTRWVRPWKADEADAFYDDMVAGARFFGIPSELIPPDRASFGAYLDQMLERADLGATATSRAMVHEVLWFRHRLIPRAAVRLLRVLAQLTLDPRLGNRLGLEPDVADIALAERLDRMLRRSYRRLPAWRRRLPNLYLALRRPTIGLGRRLGIAQRRGLLSGLHPGRASTRGLPPPGRGTAPWR